MYRSYSVYNNSDINVQYVIGTCKTYINGTCMNVICKRINSWILNGLHINSTYPVKVQYFWKYYLGGICINKIILYLIFDDISSFNVSDRRFSYCICPQVKCPSNIGVAKSCCNTTLFMWCSIFCTTQNADYKFY